MSIEAEALAFHEQNPHVLQAIKDVCMRMKRFGLEHWSINAAFEVVRYSAITTQDSKEYKLNNNYRAYYARMVMQEEPSLNGFFETREQK